MKRLRYVLGATERRAALAVVGDQGAVAGQYPAALAGCPVVCDVEDHVVSPAEFGVVLGGVVDHVGGAERSDELDVGGAADPGDLRSERSGDLHEITTLDSMADDTRSSP